MRPFFIGAQPWEGTLIKFEKIRTGQLSPMQRRYVRFRWGPDRMTQIDAYREAVRRKDGTYPVARNSASVAASRMEKRIRETPSLWQGILAAAEIDDYTLAGALNWALSAMKTEFYQGQAVAEVQDNGVRMQAVQLLAELLGHRKNAVEITGRVDFGAAIANIAAKVQEREAAEQAPEQSAENGAGGDGS